MNQQPLISVIVPVYKAEEYLDRCIGSITEQTYENLEILLVDDGSPGRSGAICDVWGERDSRITVIHKENGGTGQARNVALDRSRGEFVAFLDCDDYLAPEMLEHLYGLMDPQTDVAECSFLEVWDDEARFPEGEETLTLCTPQEAMAYHIQDTIFRQIVWNKLYRREAIGQIRFADGIRSDDEFFTYRVIGNSRKLIHTSKVLHAYRQQPNSVMHKDGYALWNLQSIQGRQERLAYLEERMPELVYQAKVNLFFLCLYARKKSIRFLSPEDQKQAEAVIFQAVQALRPLGPSIKLSLSENLWLMLAQLSFDGVCKFQNYLDKRKEG